MIRGSPAVKPTCAGLVCTLLIDVAGVDENVAAGRKSLANAGRDSTVATIVSGSVHPGRRSQRHPPTGSWRAISGPDQGTPCCIQS
jgi:hypothetical protein